MVGASVLCPGHGGSHVGTPGSPPDLCPGHGCCWVGFSPNALIWKSSLFRRVHPKRGMAWGSTHHPDGKAIPCGYGGKNQVWGEKSHFSQCGAGPDARGMGSCPCWMQGTDSHAGPAAGFGMLGAASSPCSAAALSPVTTSQCHALSLKDAAKWSGKAPGWALGWIRPQEFPIHHHATKGLVKSNPPKNPLPNVVGIKRGRTN